MNTNQTSARSSCLDKLPQTLNTANSISAQLNNFKGSVMKTKMSSSKTQATLLSVALAAAVLALNAHATSLESLATVPEAQENAAAVLAGEENGAAQLNLAAELAAQQSLPITYFESPNLKALLGNKASPWVPEKGATRKIIVVESGNQNKDLIRQLLAEGNFVVSIGNTEVNTTKSAFDMLMDIADSGTLKKSREAYDTEQASMTADTGDGQFVKENVSAYFYSPSGSGSFHAVARDPLVGVAKAIQWARDEVMTSGLPTAKEWASAPAYTRTDNVVCKSGNTKAGDVNYRTAFTKLSSDGSSTYDYWTVKYTMQMVPNYSNTTYRWKNDYSVIRGAGGPTRPLLDYAPTTTSSGSTVSVGLDSAGVASISWSYTLTDISITDGGTFSSNLAKWTHEINQNSATGRNTVKMEPGALFRVPQGDASVWTKLVEEHDAGFVSETANITEKKTCRKRWN